MFLPKLTSKARDVVYVACFAVGAFALSVALELGEVWHVWAEDHEGLELHEVPFAMAMSALALAWFAVRRWREHSRQLTVVQQAEARMLTHINDLEIAHAEVKTQQAELVRLAADRQVAVEMAEAASRAKSRFLANTSHELRTPLNAIIGFSDIIKNETFGPVGSTKYRGYAVDINDSGVHLLGLINDILDLSKIEAGEQEVFDESIDVAAVTRSALMMVNAQALSKQISIDVELPDGLPGLRADCRKIKQILVNLLSNAVKFTEAGGDVGVGAWREERGLFLQVKDSGIGIAPDDVATALAQFGQIDSTMARQYNGTGLGLPLAKAIAELHGGTLDLQSTVGVGTTITVWFPADRVVDRTPGTDAELVAG